MLIAFNKPFGVICQFSPSGGKPTLADYIRVPNVYPAGRLDTDSEGLMLLTDDGALQAAISSPRKKLLKRYWAQVEGTISAIDLAALQRPMDLGDFVTQPAVGTPLDELDIWPRTPPIRSRVAIPTSWCEITLTEGKNRQVRRMTAKLGFPTLRLIRVAIGQIELLSEGLNPGEWRELSTDRLWKSDRIGQKGLYK